MPSRDPSIRRQLRAAAQAAMSKKAHDPVLLDVRKLAGFCDYFLLCHGNQPVQIQAIADAVETRLEKGFGLRAAHREGGRDAEWLALDYTDFIVHIFSPKTRKFYALERLWSGAPHLRLPEPPAAGS
jgi:ribosome-associated protein